MARDGCRLSEPLLTGFSEVQGYDLPRFLWRHLALRFEQSLEQYLLFGRAKALPPSAPFAHLCQAHKTLSCCGASTFAGCAPGRFGGLLDGQLANQHLSKWNGILTEGRWFGQIQRFSSLQ